MKRTLGFVSVKFGRTEDRSTVRDVSATKETGLPVIQAPFARLA